MKLRHYITIAVCTLAQVTFMYSVWHWTDAKVIGMILWQIFALIAGTTLGLWLAKRKKARRKKRKPQIFTYTKQGRCLEGVYEQCKIG